MATVPDLVKLAVERGYKSSAVHAHHIVMKVGNGKIGKSYTKFAQKMLKDAGIDLLEDAASFKRAGADDWHNLCYALNYADGIHSTKYQRYITKELWRAKKEALAEGKDVGDALKAKLAEWKDLFHQGEDFWNK